MGAPNLLAIGHVSEDASNGGYRLGGAVTYGALTASRLGLRPAVVTSARPDFDVSALGVPVHVVSAPSTTTFRDSYSVGKRRQTVESVARSITLDDVPTKWRSARLVLLAPVAQEVDPALARHFDKSVVVAAIQGWLRSWDRSGTVTPRRWEGRDVLPHVDAAVVSADDVADPGLIELWAELASVLIVTKGKEGAEMHRAGAWEEIAPFPVDEVDPTGAGDVFAAAYLAAYGRGGDPVEAARFASCAASFCVEAEGTAGVPTASLIHARLRSSRPGAD